MDDVLFQPFQLGKLTLQNRFILSAAADNLENVPLARIGRYTRLAEGHIGLIITGGSRLPKIEGFKPIVDCIHQHGGKIAVQLVTEPGPGLSAVRKNIESAPAVSIIPNDSVWFNDIIRYGKHHAVTEDEIKAIIQTYVVASVKAKTIGADAVQIHAAHHSFPSQFLSPITNHRNDEWGGSLENRTRFHVEIYKAIRAAVGDEFPIFIKFGIEDSFQNGLAAVDGLKAAAMMAHQGCYDLWEISQGIMDYSHWNGTPMHTAIRAPADEAYFRTWSRSVKQQIQQPVALTGGIRSCSVAETLVLNSETDLIGMCRPFIREPNLLNRWKNGDTRKASCISCNQCVTKLLQAGKPLACFLDLLE